MAIGLLAQVGVGIVTSIMHSLVSDVFKSSDTPETTVAQTLAAKVSISDEAAALTQTSDAAKTVEAINPLDKLFAGTSDSVKAAWEKTRETLGLDTGNQAAYYLNDQAVMALMAQNAPLVASGKPGEEGIRQVGAFGSVDSALDAVNLAIGKLNATPQGYDVNPRGRQAALEMYATFRQNLMNA
ncbi:MAG: hypothetical protein LBM56_01370 [Burkholderiaceae bacterium]|jgi:hypothetical protein|nr:hypothetical protein [Burkholderiaceae bacterium]